MNSRFCSALRSYCWRDCSVCRGWACGALLILAMAAAASPFGYDYLYPLMPPGKAALRDGFVRAIWSRLAQKGEVLPRHAKE